MDQAHNNSNSYVVINCVNTESFPNLSDPQTNPCMVIMQLTAEHRMILIRGLAAYYNAVTWIPELQGSSVGLDPEIKAWSNRKATHGGYGNGRREALPSCAVPPYADADKHSMSIKVHIKHIPLPYMVDSVFFYFVISQIFNKFTSTQQKFRHH